MEVPGMDKVKKGENHISSASAFVKKGIQDECDDACSICLEAFSNCDPSTVTICRHEFHLQCILECVRLFELEDLRTGRKDKKRTYVFSFMVRCQRSSNCPMCWQPISLKGPLSQELFFAVEQERQFRSSPSTNAAMYHHPTPRGFQLQHVSLQPVQVNNIGMFPLIATENRSYLSEASSIDRAGPSDLQSSPDTWRSRLSSMSMKYKESISENSRIWKDKLFSRSSTSMADIISEVRTEIHSGISRIMERLETRDYNRDAHYERPSNGSNTTTSSAS